MGLELKKKPLTRKQLTNIILDYEERFELIADTMETLILKQPDYTGCIQLNTLDVNEKWTNYYTVTKFCIVEPYITFYHLLPPDNYSPFNINSFPEKPDNQSTRKYIKDLEKTKKWNKVYENIFIPAIERTQFIGKFTYTQAMDLEDNPANFDRIKAEVLPLKTDN